jgi:hypothetical protein
LPTPVYANEMALYSVNTGSFVYHMTGNHGQYNEKFNNQFFSVERKLSADSKYSLLVGTMKNSFADRCLSLGRRDWYAGASGWTFKGVYAYTGEFSLKPFAIAAIQAPIERRRKSPASVSLLYLSWPAVQFYRLFRRGNGHYRPGHL